MRKWWVKWESWHHTLAAVQQCSAGVQAAGVIPSLAGVEDVTSRRLLARLPAWHRLVKGLRCILFVFIWIRTNVRFPWLQAACMLDDQLCWPLDAGSSVVLPGHCHCMLVWGHSWPSDSEQGPSPGAQRITSDPLGARLTQTHPDAVVFVLCNMCSIRFSFVIIQWVLLAVLECYFETLCRYTILRHYLTILILYTITWYCI